MYEDSGWFQFFIFLIKKWILVHYRAKLNFILACNPVGSMVDITCALKRIVTFLLNQEIYISYSYTTYTVDHILSFYRYNLRVWDENCLIFLQ